LTFEDVDWSLFDIVSVDHYREARIKDRYVEMLQPLLGLGKPVLVTEVGMRGYQGAESSGVLGFGIADTHSLFLHHLPTVGRFVRPHLQAGQFVRDEAFFDLSGHELGAQGVISRGRGLLRPPPIRLKTITRKPGARDRFDDLSPGDMVWTHPGSLCASSRVVQRAAARLVALPGFWEELTCLYAVVGSGGKRASCSCFSALLLSPPAATARRHRMAPHRVAAPPRREAPPCGWEYFRSPTSRRSTSG
jgi:hypothetical protein